MKKHNAEATTEHLQEGLLINLDPNEIAPHPVIAYLESHGVFPIGSADIDKMAESVAATGGFLQPIVVTPDPSSPGKYNRIIGRRRTETAKRLSMSIPCYIRNFSSDEEIINAWKTENFVRAQYTTVQQLTETERIQRIWSKRTSGRIKNAQKCVPELQELIEKGVFQMRKDEDLIAALSSQPIDIQQLIATAYNNATVVKTEFKEQIKEIVKDPELKKELQERNDEIANLESKLKELNEKLGAEVKKSTKLKTSNEKLEAAVAESGNGSEESKRLEEVYIHNQDLLKAEIKDKEKLIKELEQKNLNALQQVAGKIHDTLIKQTNHIHILTKRLLSETTATMTLIKDEIKALKCEPEVKEHQLVMKDSLDKAKILINKDFEAIDKLLSDSLIAIESLAVGGNRN